MVLQENHTSTLRKNDRYIAVFLLTVFCLSLSCRMLHAMCDHCHAGAESSVSVRDYAGQASVVARAFADCSLCDHEFIISQAPSVFHFTFGPRRYFRVVLIFTEWAQSTWASTSSIPRAPPL